MSQNRTFADHHEVALYMVEKFGVLAALQAQECARAMVAAGKTGEASHWFKIQEAICQLPQ